MKKYLLALLFIIPVLFVLFLVSARPAAAFGLTSPVGGEIWPVGSSQTVTWSTDGISGTVVCIFLDEEDRMLNLNLNCSNPGNDGIQIVTIPEVAPGNYRIKLQGFIESVNNTPVFSVSNPFQITAAAQTAELIIDTPINGAQFRIGDTIHITWRAPSYIPVGAIMYLTRYNSGGIPVGSQNVPVPNIGSYDDEVRNDGTFVVGTLYYYKLVWGSDTANSGNFSIIASAPPPTTPFITDLATNKTSYAIGETIRISWTDNLTDPTLKLRRFNASTNQQVASADVDNTLGDVYILAVGSPNFTIDTSYYYTLSNQAGTVSDQSNTFEICAASGCDAGGDDGGGDDGDDDIVPGVVPGWKEPPNAPTECTDSSVPGCHPPVNISDADQVKGGGFGVRALSISPTGFLKLLGLRAAAGEFLTTNSAGKVILATPSANDGSSWTVTRDGLNQYSAVTGNVGIGYDTIANTDSKLLVVDGRANVQVPAALVVSSSASPSSGFKVKTQNGSAETKIFEAASGPARGISRFSVLGDGQVCIGTDCRTDWPEATGGGITQIRVENGLESNMGGHLINDSNSSIHIRTDCAAGKILKFNANGIWDCADDIANTSTTGGTVTSVAAGSGLAVMPGESGGSITTSGTLSLKRNCAFGQVLKWMANVGGQSGNSQWMCANDDTGSATGGDNLGDHTATKNINLNGNWLSYGSNTTLGRGIKISGSQADGSNSIITIGNEGAGAPVTINSNLLKILTNTNPVSGYVLTAKDSTGQAEWKSLPSLGLSCTNSSVDINPDLGSGKKSATAVCASGYTVTGGGLKITNYDNFLSTANTIFDYPDGNGWTAVAGVGGATIVRGSVYARCCKIQ